MSFLDHLRRANNWDRTGFWPFSMADRVVGYIRPDRIEHLRAFPDIFVIGPDQATLAPGLGDFEARSAAMETVLRALREAGEFPGWRDEYYPVMPEWDDAPLMRVERASCPWLGVRSWGVHINGFVRRDDGLHMWVARRSLTKPTFPGMLDNMVAGGQPIGMGLLENVIKECAEEAGIPADIAAGARAVSVVPYFYQIEDGVKPNQEFCYDLELPTDFTPRNTDGEVESFELWPIERVIETVRETVEFKYNCNLVIIDFLIRHGLIDADGEPDYVALCLGLRQAVRPGFP